MLTACVEDDDERDVGVADLALDSESDFEPTLDTGALALDGEVRDSDAEISPPDMSEGTRDQEITDMSPEVITDLEPAPDPDMDALDPDMALPDMVLPDMASADMTPEPAEVEWAECEHLCLTEDPERLDGCSSSCEPIAPEACRQDCDPTNTVNAWSNTEYIDLGSPYDELHVSDAGFVVQRTVLGNHNFELRAWSGALIHSLTFAPTDYTEIDVHLSREAVLIYHEWDNAFGGELFLYSWEGAELAREVIMYMNYVCRRPALFRDRVIYSALGPTYECFDTPINYDRAMYASQLVSVSAFKGFDYDIAVDDFEPYYRLNARYYGHSEGQTTVGTLSGDTHDAQVEAVSDVGFIYRDERGALQLATPPVSSEARWTYHALAGLTPDSTDAFQVKSGAYEALYGAHDSGVSHDLYQLTMNGAAPQRFELVRRFAEPISKLTDHHMITREEERGVWVRHRRPACTVDGQCVCLNDAALPDCR